MTKYKVETPLGTFERNSKRTYSHIVVIKAAEGYVTAEWAGRADLAENIKRKWNNGWSWQGFKVAPTKEVYIVEIKQ